MEPAQGENCRSIEDVLEKQLLAHGRGRLGPRGLLARRSADMKAELEGRRGFARTSFSQRRWASCFHAQVGLRETALSYNRPSHRGDGVAAPPFPRPQFRDFLADCAADNATSARLARRTEIAEQAACRTSIPAESLVGMGRTDNGVWSAA